MNRIGATEILRIIQDMLVQQFDLKPGQVTAGTELVELGIDSVAAIELMFLLEERFSLPASAEPEEVRTVGDIAEHIRAMVSERCDSHGED